MSVSAGAGPTATQAVEVVVCGCGWVSNRDLTAKRHRACGGWRHAYHAGCARAYRQRAPPQRTPVPAGQQRSSAGAPWWWSCVEFCRGAQKKPSVVALSHGEPSASDGAHGSRLRGGRPRTICTCSTDSRRAHGRRRHPHISTAHCCCCQHCQPSASAAVSGAGNACAACRSWSSGRSRTAGWCWADPGRCTLASCAAPAAAASGAQPDSTTLAELQPPLPTCRRHPAGPAFPGRCPFQRRRDPVWPCEPVCLALPHRLVVHSLTHSLSNKFPSLLVSRWPQRRYQNGDHHPAQRRPCGLGICSRPLVHRRR